MQKIQDIYKALGDYGCLIFCYLYEAGIKVDITKHFETLVELDIIDNDCYVNDGNRLLKFFGSDKRIARGTNDVGNTIVPYSYSDKEHFVVINNKQEIIFNSLENSTCVRLGEPNWEKARYLC
jgi:hypothetical protein